MNDLVDPPHIVSISGPDHPNVAFRIKLVLLELGPIGSNHGAISTHGYRRRRLQLAAIAVEHFAPRPRVLRQVQPHNRRQLSAHWLVLVRFGHPADEDGVERLGERDGLEIVGFVVVLGAGDAGQL